MLWFLLIIPAVLLVLLFRSGRRVVCLRRKDCCGKGCGCIFPRKHGER